MFTTNCEFCNEPVDTRANGSYKRVVGWVQNKGGAIALPSAPIGWAHYSCIETEKKSPIDRNSPTLL